jgi:peptide/nickel transport system ATP-binding protein
MNLARVNPVLTIKDVSKTFGGNAGWFDWISSSPAFGVKAVQDITLDLFKGEVLGLVGESGCGKSTLGRMAAGLLKPTSGEVLLNGEKVDKRPGSRNGLKLQMVFQNPMASLNARMSIGRIIGEAPVVHGLVRRSEIRDYVASVLDRVGLDPDFMSRRPDQCSGGQRQRVGIARALAVNPEVLICDEPVTALDVSIQAHILNLFMELRQELKLPIIFISHDLRVVKHIADRVAIMYLGRIVEVGAAREVLSSPSHPYTLGLLESQPQLGTGRRQFHPVNGEIPSPTAPPPGCAYHPRCSYAVDICRTDRPPLRPLGSRLTACHLAEKLFADTASPVAKTQSAAV